MSISKDVIKQCLISKGPHTTGRWRH